MRQPRTTRRRGALAALVVVAVGAGCSSPRPSAVTTSTSGASSTTTTTTTSSATSVATARCRAADLSLALVGTEGAAGTFEVTFEMRNASAGSCTLDGYPGAQLLANGGAAMATDVVRGGSYSFTDFAPADVVLATGASAFFNMAYSDVPTGAATSCPTAYQLEVTPPGAVDHLDVSQEFVVCDGGKLTVSPVFGSGSPQTQTTAPART
ncbi:MAG: DUF4232 domain-containing protein [Acidimicrobiales bacterium]